MMERVIPKTWDQNLLSDLDKREWWVKRFELTGFVKRVRTQDVQPGTLDPTGTLKDELKFKSS